MALSHVQSLSAFGGNFGPGTQIWSDVWPQIAKHFAPIKSFTFYLLSCVSKNLNIFVWTNLVSHLSITNLTLRNPLSRTRNLKSLQIHISSPDDGATLMNHLPFLTSLESLSVEWGGAHVEQNSVTRSLLNEHSFQQKLPVMKHLTNLKYLKLFLCTEFDDIPQLTDLQELYLHGFLSPLTDLVSRPLTRLETLTIHSCECEPHPPIDFSVVPNLTSLQFLGAEYSSGALRGLLWDKIFDAFPHLSSFSCVPPGDRAIWKNILSSSNLTHLELRGMYTCAHVPFLRTMTQLISLSLGTMDEGEYSYEEWTEDPSNHDTEQPGFEALTQLTSLCIGKGSSGARNEYVDCKKIGFLTNLENLTFTGELRFFTYNQDELTHLKDISKSLKYFSGSVGGWQMPPMYFLNNLTFLSNLQNLEIVMDLVNVSHIHFFLNTLWSF